MGNFLTCAGVFLVKFKGVLHEKFAVVFKYNDSHIKIRV